MAARASGELTPGFTSVGVAGVDSEDVAAAAAAGVAGMSGCTTR